MAKKVVKKTKIKLLNILLILVVLAGISYGVYYSFQIPIKNIIIKNTNYLNDDYIIELAGIKNYPSFLLTSSNKMKKEISSSKYIEIGRVSNACDIYHVSKASVSSSAVKSNKYSKAKIEGGKIKVLISDLNGIWFYDDGSGIKVIKGYENGVSVYVNTATLYEKEDDDYVYKSKIYVLTDHYIDLDDEYSKEKDASEGQRRFYMDYNYDLYKV